MLDGICLQAVSYEHQGAPIELMFSFVLEGPWIETLGSGAFWDYFWFNRTHLYDGNDYLQPVWERVIINLKASNGYKHTYSQIFFKYSVRVAQEFQTANPKIGWTIGPRALLWAAQWSCEDSATSGKLVSTSPTWSRRALPQPSDSHKAWGAATRQETAKNCQLGKRQHLEKKKRKAMSSRIPYFKQQCHIFLLFCPFLVTYSKPKRWSLQS